MKSQDTSITWEDVYKLPLKNEGSYVFASNRVMAFVWLVSVSEEDKNKLISIINGDSKLRCKGDWTIQDDIELCYNNVPILMIRGWGYLTGVGGLHLPADKAFEI